MTKKSDASFEKLIAQSRLRHGATSVEIRENRHVSQDSPQDALHDKGKIPADETPVLPVETVPASLPESSPVVSGDEAKPPAVKKKPGRPLRSFSDDAEIRFVFSRSLQDQYACNDTVAVHGDCKKWVQNHIDVLGGCKAAQVSPIVCTLAAEAGKIDKRTPYNNREKGLGTLMALEQADITGSSLYRLHQVFCNKDFEKTVAVAAALHQELIQPGLLQDVLWYRSKDYTADGILADVKKQDRSFGYRP